MVREYSYKNDKDKFLTAHFQVGDFASINNKGNILTTDKIFIDDRLPEMLENLYVYLDSKYGLSSINIISGYRSNDFEISLPGGVPNGEHTKGTAVDIICINKDGTRVDAKLVCVASETVGFNGIGYGGTYTHVDVRGTKSYFDVTNGRIGIDSFYSYFNISRDNVNSTYKVGDTVNINGVYLSATSTEKFTPRITRGKITKIVSGARNQYLLDNGTIGWVNDSVIINNNVYLSNTNYTGTSIVEALNQIDVDSSYTYRQKLANVNGIDNYIGTSNQNMKMLNLLKEGKLLNA